AKWVVAKVQLDCFDIYPSPVVLQWNRFFSRKGDHPGDAIKALSPPHIFAYRSTKKSPSLTKMGLSL
ncbi:MAG: hypothetical protein OQK97_03925, partial [Deltaproteobacteria bacterium]|nr:hypothetical protein [Deltaproteobacteria bacterium]